MKATAILITLTLAAIAQSTHARAPLAVEQFGRQAAGATAGVSAPALSRATWNGGVRHVAAVLGRGDAKPNLTAPKPEKRMLARGRDVTRILGRV